MAPRTETTDDAFLGGALRILQPKLGYRAGIDALLLAASAGAQGQVLDVGAGVGVVGLALARRLVEARVLLVERDPVLAELAGRNIERNGLGERVCVIEADITRPLGELEMLQARAETFDHVLANPPYLTHGRNTPTRDAGKGAALSMPQGDLDRWFRFMAAMAKAAGMLSLVHRADALEEILAASAGRFGGLVIVPIYARPGAPASRVLVHASKGSRAPLTLQRGIVLHDHDGSFRPEIEAVLRAGAGLGVTGV
jgi:FkbM family methyltransferase